jgi:energy-coupling factor transporter ATP-binding protein EcfA2
MFRRLMLSNFCGFREFDLELAPVTVFIGPNGSGKSTLLQAMSLLTAEMRAARDTEASVRSDGVRVHRIRRRIEDAAWPAGSGWCNLLHRHRDERANAFEIAATFDDVGGVRRGRLVLDARSGEPTLEVEVEMTAAQPKCATASIEPPVRAAALSALLLSHLSRVHRDERFVDDAGLNLLQAEGRHGEIVRNGLMRLSPKSIAQINRALRVAEGAELTRCTSFSTAQPNAPLEAIFRRHDTEFELATLNPGLVNFVFLAGQVERLNEGSPADCALLLDEPEVHLHPRAQAALAERLVRLADRRSAQVVSMTHSIEVARRLGCRAQSAAFALAQTFSRPERLETEEDMVRAFERTHEMAPFASINLVSHRQILFHEGPTDYPILLACARLLFGDQPVRLRRFEKWTPVSLGGAANAPTGDLLGHLVSTKLIRSLDTKDCLSMLTVLDRDYTRKPGFVEIRNGRIFHTKKTWARHSIESLFLDADLLVACLSVLLAGEHIAPEDLERLVAEAVAAADRDPTLLKAAEDALAEQRKSAAAQDAARAEVRAQPEIWQRGKDRAAFILGYVRRALPIGMQRKVRSTIDGMLDDIPTGHFSPEMVPDEIRGLLEKLAS